MPPYQTFLSGANLATFWNNVKWFLFLIAPIIMIFFATDTVGFVIRIIRKAFGAVDEPKRENDDDDVYYY
jgi:hypothetical protein